MSLSDRMSNVRYTRLAQSLPANVPFVAPEQQERQRGAPFTARLGANENVFGPSPEAISALQQNSDRIWMYGDPISYDLRNAIADHMEIRPDNIVVGEGIDGLLAYLVRLMIEPGDVVVTSDGAYPTFNYHVSGYGGVLHKVAYNDDHEDLDALFSHASEVGAKIIYLANPDNPMGTWHLGVNIKTALENVPSDCLLLLDEAYVEFAPSGTAVDVSADDPRVIRMRTFSKAYGMAGARVGYAVGAPDLIRNFDKIRNHFGMNRSAQIGALAALQDQGWLTQTVGKVADARSEIAKIAIENGLTSLPSATNFVAVDCGADGDFARAVLTGLVKRGVFVRMPFVPPQDRCIRVSCGRPEDLACFKAALPEALEDARK